MLYSIKVHRGWDGACDNAMELFDVPCTLHGQTVRLISIDMTMTHVLTLMFAPATGVPTRMLKYWLRALIKTHR